MAWPRRKPAPPKEQVVEGVARTYFDERMAALEERVGELTELERKVRQTIVEARRAKAELETTMAASRRRQRGGW